jgi:hypothetical protein
LQEKAVQLIDGIYEDRTEKKKKTIQKRNLKRKRKRKRKQNKNKNKNENKKTKTKTKTKTNTKRKPTNRMGFLVCIYG